MTAKIINNELMTGNVQAARAIAVYAKATPNDRKYYWLSETHKRKGTKCFPSIEKCLLAAAKTLGYKVVMV